MLPSGKNNTQALPKTKRMKSGFALMKSLVLLADEDGGFAA